MFWLKFLTSETPNSRFCHSLRDTPYIGLCSSMSTISIYQSHTWIIYGIRRSRAWTKFQGVSVTENRGLQICSIFEIACYNTILTSMLRVTARKRANGCLSKRKNVEIAHRSHITCSGLVHIALFSYFLQKRGQYIVKNDVVHVIQ